MIAAAERRSINAPSKEVRVGIAASNLANGHNPEYTLPEQIAPLAEMLAIHDLGVELQFEGIAPRDVPVFPRPAFLGIHQPIVDVDLADPARRERSFEKLFTAMETAQQTGADYLTLHMQTKDYWDDLHHRGERIDRSFADLGVLLGHHKKRGFGFQMIVENVEFPKFPATREELARVQEYLRGVGDVPMGIVLDVGHLWHSGFLMQENLWRREVSSIADGWGRQQQSFDRYLEETLLSIGEDLTLIHLTGCRDHRTHDLPGTLPNDPSHAVIGRQYGTNELDVQKSVHVVAVNAQHLGTVTPIINEAMGYPYEDIVANTLEISSAVSLSEVSLIG